MIEADAHTPRKRQIFALLDDRLKPRAKQKLLHHLSECSACADYYHKMQKLRTQAVSAWPIEAPDWSRIDSVVQSAYQELARTPARRPIPIGPLFLTLGAAAAAIALLLLPLPTQQPPKRNITPGPTINHTSVSAEIIDAFPKEKSPEIFHAVQASESIRTTSCQGVRLRFGKGAVADVGSTSTVGVITLAEYTPKIELLRGDMSLNIPKSSAPQHGGVEVLAGGAQFQVLYGIVELSWQDGQLAVRITEGKVDAILDSRVQSLETGHWQYQPARFSESNQQPLLSRMNRVQSSNDNDLAPSEALKERSPKWIERGTLSKRVIRKVLAPVMPKLRGCYEQALKRAPQLTLTTSLRVTVNKRGQISKVKTRGIGGQHQLKACFEEVTKAALFPPSEGGSVEFILPLRLYPRH